VSSRNWNLEIHTYDYGAYQALTTYTESLASIVADRHCFSSLIATFRAIADCGISSKRQIPTFRSGIIVPEMSPNELKTLKNTHTELNASERYPTLE
jgi:hypothetical protein